MSSFLVHGFLPDEMMAVALVPIIKSKSGRIMSKDNYRPIALASIVSKVLEKILLNRLYIFLDTCSNQFGFKKKHSTDQCVFVLKELIDSYRMLNGSVFTCFLDASKAFDREITHYYLTSYMPEVFLSISSDYLFIGTNTSECVYDGEGYILVHLQSLMGSVRGNTLALSLTFMSMI